MSTAHGTEKDERRDGRPSGGLPDRLRRANQTPCGFQLVEQPRGLGLGVVSGSATTPSSAARWQLIEDSQDRNVGDRSIMAWFTASAEPWWSPAVPLATLGHRRRSTRH